MIRRMASAVLCRALLHFKSMLISFKLLGFAVESDAKRTSSSVSSFRFAITCNSNSPPLVNDVVG
jgi:hypothetical protein